MIFSLSIEGVVWKPVITVPQGTVLEKGAKDKWYPHITKAAGQVSARYGCYAWGSDTEIFYCGSYAGDYINRGKTASNLQMRVQQYLQNHSLSRNGIPNTNWMVFQKVNTALQSTSVIFFHLTFEHLWFSGQCFDFEAYSNDSDLVMTVEQFLINLYRRQNQCAWNRT